MADEKELSPEDQAKKDREDAVKEQDNPPQPYPTPEQLNKQQTEGGPIDEGDDVSDDDAAAAKRKKAEDAKAAEEAKKADQQRSLEANKPGGGYTTR